MLTDAQIVALTLWGEARSEPVEGRIAVACVLRNRLRAGRWGRTYDSVCLWPYQFSCWNHGDPNLPKLDAFRTQFEAGKAPVDTVLRECLWIADGLMVNAILPRVGQSTHYYATSLVKPPKWAAGGQFIARIGRHLFFEGVQ